MNKSLICLNVLMFFAATIVSLKTAMADMPVCVVKGQVISIDEREKTITLSIDDSEQYSDDCKIFNTFGMEPVSLIHNDMYKTIKVGDRGEGKIKVSFNEQKLNGMNVGFSDIHDVRPLKN